MRPWADQTAFGATSRLSDANVGDGAGANSSAPLADLRKGRTGCGVNLAGKQSGQRVSSRLPDLAKPRLIK